MKLKGSLLLATLTVGLMGCKPDAAVRRGATIDDSTGTPSGRKNADQPTLVPPSTDKSQPLKKVQ